MYSEGVNAFQIMYIFAHLACSLFQSKIAFGEVISLVKEGEYDRMETIQGSLEAVDTESQFTEEFCKLNEMLLAGILI